MGGLETPSESAQSKDTKSIPAVWFPYAKPTRYMHSSGYRIFEVGYCQLGSDNRVSKKVKLGGCDHIYTDYMVLTGDNRPFAINMDLTKDGYIRFFNHRYSLKWDIDEFSVSDMGLIEGEYKATTNLSAESAPEGER